MRKTSLLYNCFHFAFAALLLVSCQSDDEGVGQSLFSDSNKPLSVAYVNVVSFSQDHLDSIRTDRNYLPTVSIGAYDDAVFGKTKASFYSQVRLSTLNPNFGVNPVVDSVELFIPIVADPNNPIFSDLEVVIDAENKVLLDAFQIEKSNIYGDATASMTVKVSEIKDPTFLIPNSQKLTADMVFAPDQILGSSTITNKVISKQFFVDEVNTFTESTGFRVALDNLFFQQKVLDNQGDALLQDQASFINLFNGIKIEVQEDNGFVFNSNPSSFRLTIYYHNDELEGQKYNFDFSNTNNLRFASYQNESAPDIAFANSVLGDETLYLQGLGGSRAIIKIDENQLNSIKDSVQNKGWVINNARFKFYVDTDKSPINTEEFPLSLFLYVEDQNSGFSQLLDDYFLEDSEKEDRFKAGSITPEFDVAGLFYTVNLTEHIKNIVEGGLDSDGNPKENHDLVLSVGNLVGVTSKSGFYGRTDPYFQDRSYNPSRIAIFGNQHSDDSKKLMLEIFYTKSE